MGVSITQNHAHFSSGFGFIVGLGEPKLCTKFEVPSFNHCVNIEVEPQNFGELPQPKAMPTFSYGCDFMMGLGKPKLCTKLEVASFSHCVNTEWKPPNFGELP